MFNLGTVRLEGGRLDEAEVLLRRSLQINPVEPMAHNNLGVLYARRGQRDLAASAFSREIEVNPGYADAYFNLATSRASSGNPQEAVRLWEKTLELNPTHVRALESLSGFYARKEIQGVSRISFKGCRTSRSETGDNDAISTAALRSTASGPTTRHHNPPLKTRVSRVES